MLKHIEEQKYKIKKSYGKGTKRKQSDLRSVSNSDKSHVQNVSNKLA